MGAYDDIPPAAAALHRSALVFDAHADTLTEMTDRGYDLDAGLPGTHLDLPRCADGVLDAQVLTCFVHPRCLPDGAAARVRALLTTWDRQVARLGDRVALCEGPGEVAAARDAGRLAVVLAIEGGHAIEDDLELLADFRRHGVRTMTLTWNNSNGWADGCGDDGPHGGLTPFGRDVVAAMEELGMVVDVSHAAESTFDDVLACATRPLLASHSCARALREHRRNLHDAQLRALAESGGVACVNFYPHFLVAEGEADVDDVVAHVLRFLEVAGEDHVGLGGDYDGIPVGPKGAEDVTGLPRVTAGLLARGVSERVLRKVLGGNLLRLFDGGVQGAGPKGAIAERRAVEAGGGPSSEGRDDPRVASRGDPRGDHS
ncbi:MAG: membrane dipeptidase [Planctomycetes bacterium]|nr:membrane dipeptidase [Planctomycetota bacterium]